MAIEPDDRSRQSTGAWSREPAIGWLRNARRILFVIVSVLALASSPTLAQEDIPDPMTMPLLEVERLASNEHPYLYFVLASREFQAGEEESAVRWLYIGQLRWRFHMMVNPDLPPDQDAALFASLMEVVGRPINEWAGGSVDGWIGSIDAALEWDEANPNGVTDKEEHREEHRRVQEGLVELRESIERQRDDIPAIREGHGLENRAR